MNNLTDLNTHYNILSQARYLTDLSIAPKGDSKILSLRWYARIPLVGRAVSYIRYLVCHPGMIHRQLLELSQKHENDFKAKVINFLDSEDIWGEGVDKIYRHYTLLQQLFSQISHLPKSGCALKIDWQNFLQESTFTQAIMALNQLDTKNPNARKIVHFHAMMKKIDATAQILQRTAPVVDKQSVLDNLGDTRLFRTLKDKSQQILKALNPLNPLEQLLMCDTGEVLELTIELSKLIRHPFFQGAFPAAYQEFNQIYQRLQPDITQVPQKLLLKHLQGLSLHDILRFVDDFPAAREIADPIIRNKAEEEKRALIQRLQEALQHDDKWWDMRMFLTNDETFSQMIPKDMRTILWSDLISPKELQAAVDALKNIANTPYSKLSIIDKLEKVYNLHKSLKESHWQIDFQDKAKEFKAILDLYDSYDVKYDTYFKLKTKATTIVQAMKGLQDWEQLRKLKEIGGVKSLRKELLQSIEDNCHVDEFLPTLIEEFKSLCKQLYRSFEDLAPESQQAYISSLPNKQLYRFAKKHKAYEKAVEQELANRVPGIYGKLLASIKAQLTACPKATGVADKLTQMEMETTTQVKPANVQEVLDYLNKQRDTLARVLGMAPRKMISSIKLPCLERIMSQFDEDAYASTMDMCYSHCSIHQGLKQAFVWSIFYSLQTQFNVPDFNDIFQPMLKKEPLMAVQMILWNPRNTDLQLRSAKEAIKSVLEAATSKHGTPFDLLPQGGIKSKFLQLASHLERNSNLALLAQELAPYKGKWAALEIELNGWLKEKRNDPVQFDQLRDAAGFISTSEYFEKHHAELFKVAKAFCYRCTPELSNLATEQVFKLIGAVENGDKRNYPLLPWRKVCKEWNALIERKIALEMPENLVSMTDRVVLWVLSRPLMPRLTPDQFMEKKQTLKQPFIDEINKLIPPHSFEEAKEYWVRVHLTVLNHFKETLVLVKKGGIPKELQFPCLSSLIMGNIHNGKENSKQLTCCPVHNVLSGQHILAAYEKYMADPRSFTDLPLPLNEFLIGLAKVDFDKMMSMALIVKSKGHRTEDSLYRILSEAASHNWHGQWTDEFSSLMANLYSQFEHDMNPVTQFLLDKIKNPNIRLQTCIIISSNYQKRSDKFKWRSDEQMAGISLEDMLKYYAEQQKEKIAKQEKKS